MPELILGPLLRRSGSSDATVWVEADAPCEVEVLAGDSFHRSRTFRVGDHHYALVHVTGLESGSSYEYEVSFDGEKVWPEPDSPFPSSVIRTLGEDLGEGEIVKLVFGSCRISAPHEPPYSLCHEEEERGLGMDALYAMAMRLHKRFGGRAAARVRATRGPCLRPQAPAEHPRVHPLAARPEGAPGEEVADFEEYTRLYCDSWKDPAIRDPAIRWLLSTVPSVMIFDDHEVSDGWNISDSSLEETRAKPWWNAQIIGANAS